MAAFALAVDARCPVCGAPILSVGVSGRVLAEDLHLVPLRTHDRRLGQGYTVCDDCGTLAEMTEELTLN
jgi:hypothetical protein